MSTPQTTTFDFDHYKAIHYFLFSDLYEWAGEVRTVNISKKGQSSLLLKTLNVKLN